MTPPHGGKDTLLEKIEQHHHDGHGLNDQIIIVSDPRDPDAGNASHHYEATLGGEVVVSVKFQHGLRESGKPGATDAALLAIILDRYEGFQAGPYGCRENSLVVTKLQEALHWMKHRADERARRGVLGKNAK